jgi:hypothetical protein
MKTFLEEFAEQIHGGHPDLENVVVVLPNRRAALYLQRALSKKLTRPAFAPSLLTIEDFIASFSKYKIPDKLQLIHTLYTTHEEVLAQEASPLQYEREPFEQFYFWGEMLLRDFDELDKYMINADHLFKDLSNQKELDATFDYLTEDQKKFLNSFWSHFDENLSVNKKRFLSVWKRLPELYMRFKSALSRDGYAYQGMMHRDVAENIDRLVPPKIDQEKHWKFAGFNALTSAEETIIGHFVLYREATMHWDIDQYYVNNKTQEAGDFFREYEEHRTFKKTFPPDVPANFIKKERLRVFGAAQPIGQAKLMCEILTRELKTMNPEETLIVLPDEKLLTPVLHGIAGAVDSLNVTMGFPLSNTPLFNLVELLADLQITRKDDHFNHRQVLALLGHPYIVAADPVSSNNKRKEILKHNWVHIPSGFLATELALHRIIFAPFENDISSVGNDIGALFIHYLKKIITVIGNLDSIHGFDKEYAFHFLKLFNKVEGILYAAAEKAMPTEHDKKNTVLSLKSFLRLFRQLVKTEKIPFSGEPLRGLQVMGVLETRNLDFKNVFILSLNEGSFPSNSGKGSYLPFNIRKAYRLPTQEHQDTIYAYLFYRVLQRAENVYLFYNSETDVLGQGEMSRYLQQLIYESGIPTELKILDNAIQPQGINPIVVEKNAGVMENLFKLNEGNTYFRGISPSALNAYIECRLKFYFRHVAKIKEPSEVQEELDARVLGNFLHDVMERFYKGIHAAKGERTIEVSDFKHYEAQVDKLIDDVFIKEYRLDPDKKVIYHGQRLVVREIVKRFAHRILEIDRAYAPFTIEALEQEGVTYTINIDQPPFKAVIGGKIDRVDRKDNILRIIDYKTGKDKMNFDTIASLFARDENRNKAAFQTLLYALLYKRNFLNNGNGTTYKVTPGLINRMNLFDEEFSFGLKIGKETISDAEQFMDEFEGSLKILFNEMFDPQVPFDQTNDLANCKLCPYGQICYR